MTIEVDGSVTCHYPFGVPHTPLGPQKPFLWFTKDTMPVPTRIGHFMLFDELLNNDVPFMTIVNFPIVCSFNGGCKVIISGNGLSSDLRNPDHATVTVCGQECEFTLDDPDTSDLQAACWIGGAPDVPQNSPFGLGRRRLHHEADTVDKNQDLTCNAQGHHSHPDGDKVVTCKNEDQSQHAAKDKKD